MNLSDEQQARLDAIQQRRRKLPKLRRGETPAWASVEDVEAFVRLVSDRVKTVYIYELGDDAGYDWTMWTPAEARHEGTLIKSVTLEPEPRHSQ